MRGSDGRAGELFAYVDLERRVPTDHPLRLIRAVVNAALGELSGALGQLYARLGRPSIPPEKLLRALLLQAFYSIRSERQLMERLEFDLLFRWFVGLGIEDPVWDASTFSKNRDRLLAGEMAARFLATVLGQDPIPRHRTGRLGLHPRGDGVQPDPPAQAAAERAMNPLAQPARRIGRSRPSTPPTSASSRPPWPAPSAPSPTSSSPC
jgi:transposase